MLKKNVMVYTELLYWMSLDMCVDADASLICMGPYFSLGGRVG